MKRTWPATTTAGSRSTGRPASQPSGHGGQIVVSATTTGLVESALPAGVAFRDLGRHALRDVPAPEQLFQLDVPGLPHDFPPLRLLRASDREPARSTDHLRRAGGRAGRARGACSTPSAWSRSPVRAGSARRASPSSSPDRAGRTCRDGAWFVPLDDVTDPGLVTAAIARTLGPVRWRRATGGRSAADVPRRSLAAARARQLRAPAGRRRRGRGAGASVAGIPLHRHEPRPAPRRRASRNTPFARCRCRWPMPASQTSLEATQLFVDRARAVRPDWEPGPDLPVVDEICALLDGLPLGHRARRGAAVVAASRQRHPRPTGRPPATARVGAA